MFLYVLALLYTWIGVVRMEAKSGALVLYDEQALPAHYKPYKNFQFGDHHISIKQSWAEDGVAGIVWDAVGL